MRISKGKIKFSRKDLWNLDSTLSEVIVQALEQFKTTKKHSIPPHLYRDFDGNEICNAHEIEMTDEQFEQEWLKLLNIMQEGFKPIKPFYEIEVVDFHWDSLFNPEKFSPEQLAPNEEGLYEWHRKLKDGKTQEEYDAYLERADNWYKLSHSVRENGRKYFIAYFDNLWD